MHVNSRAPISRALNSDEGGTLSVQTTHPMAFKLGRTRETAMETSLSMSKFVDCESNTDKFVRKSKDAPFLLLGITGCTLACAYGAYMFKKRNLPMSLYLIQLRVAAQGTVVGCLACGLAYTLARDYIFSKPSLSEVKK